MGGASGDGWAVANHRAVRAGRDGRGRALSGHLQPRDSTQA